jgi:hypothetical protein
LGHGPPRPTRPPWRSLRLGSIHDRYIRKFPSHTRGTIRRALPRCFPSLPSRPGPPSRRFLSPPHGSLTPRLPRTHWGQRSLLKKCLLTRWRRMTSVGSEVLQVAVSEHFIRRLFNYGVRGASSNFPEA